MSIEAQTGASAPRQLILCCDGTNNNLTGGWNDTNVTKLSDLLEPEANGQLLYYDPGVGNPAELPGASLTDALSRRWERLHGLAFGKGVYENIAEAYLFLMRHYRPGDQIFLYGFSRGAFTARSIGGLVTQFGVLRPEMEGLVHTLLHVYFSDREKGGAEYQRIRAQINEMFCSGQTREAPIWFVGVWDTVASVGAPLLSRTITASPTIVGKRFCHVRHALALDEHRRAFEPRPYYVDPDYDYAAHGQSIKQLWFAGAHCDVGGGYPHPQARLAHDALLWMLHESLACGLRLPASLLDAQRQVDDAAVLAALRRPHDQPAAGAALAHSETHGNPIWALAGLKQRDPQRVENPGGKPLPVTPQEHQSVTQHVLAFPGDTAWARARPKGGVLLALAGAALFWAWAGGLLTGAVHSNASLWHNLLALGTGFASKLEANTALANWQWAWLLQCRWSAGWDAVASCPVSTLPVLSERVPGALLADLGLIACYGWLLAWGVSWSFARVAALRRAMQRRSHALDTLGMSLPLAVGADLLENLLTWAVLAWFPRRLLPGAELLVGGAMSLAAIAKWVGLAGCTALIAWSLMPRARLPLASGAEAQQTG
jgi:uncharacterized protein (DUF2235 family)